MRLHATEAEVQSSVLQLLSHYKIFAFRLNTAAFKTEGRFFRAHSLGAGAADILALVRICEECAEQDGSHGLFQPLWIECKNGKGGKQSEAQKSFQAFVELLGHEYLLADSPDKVFAWLKEHRAIR